MIRLCGVELVTAADVAGRWGDVAAARLRSWCRPTAHRPALLSVFTVAELYALTGRAVPAGTAPDAPARLPGPCGDENVYEWQRVVRADRRAREATRGPSRRALVF